MQIVKWGIIGCGDVCEVKSGPAFQQANGSQLVAVMRRDADLATDFARRHNVPFSSGEADEIINHPEVNAVYIATPPNSHEDYALRVAAAGKPCYVEKPMARSAAESRRMCQAFEAANVPLYVAFYRRGMTRFQLAKRLIDEGALGTITGVSYRFHSPRDEKLDADNLPWRLRPEIAGAGLFYDLGSHLLDALDYMFGPLQDVSGVAANVATPQIAVEDSVAMSFTVMGAPGVAQWNFAATERADSIEIWGDRAKLSLSCFGGDDLTLQGANGVQTFDGSAPQPVQLGLVQTIVDELRGQGSALSTGRSALRTMEAMDAVLADYYGGRDDEFWTREANWPGRCNGRMNSQP